MKIKFSKCLLLSELQLYFILKLLMKQSLSNFSAITQRPQAGLIQGLRAKRLSARQSVSIYMCTCVCELGSFPLFAPKHTLSLCSLHTKINEKPSWSHLVFLSCLHLIPCFLCLIHNPLVSLFPLTLSSHLYFPLMLSLKVRSLRFEKVKTAITSELSDLQKSLSLTMYLYVRSPCVQIHLCAYTSKI